MSVTQITLDPIAILQMTQYFEKHVSALAGGAVFGFIYAKQIQLRFNISMTAPLGTEKQTVQQLLARAESFEVIRKTKSKTTQSFYLEYDLVGFYCIRRRAEQSEKKLQKLSAEYSKKGAPFSLVVVVDYEGLTTNLLKDNVPHPYTNEMHTNQKICVDSMNNQNSKSLVITTMKKQTSMISHFNDKIRHLLEKIRASKLEESQLVELAEILDNYDRIKLRNTENKAKTIEAMNYSILVGLSVGRLIKQ